jgi:hypothetical protein
MGTISPFRRCGRGSDSCRKGVYSEGLDMLQEAFVLVGCVPVLGLFWAPRAGGPAWARPSRRFGAGQPGLREDDDDLDEDEEEEEEEWEEEEEEDEEEQEEEEQEAWQDEEEDDDEE